MKPVYLPPRNRGHFVQDMPPRRVNWGALAFLALDLALWGLTLTVLDLVLHKLGWL